MRNSYFHTQYSFFVGFGDACYNTQIYSILGSVYQDESAPAFAIFKFVQSTSAAIAFFYSNHVQLPYQLLILVILCVCGTISFCVVEWKVHRLSVLKRQEDSSDHIDTACGVLPESNDAEHEGNVIQHDYDVGPEVSIEVNSSNPAA